MPPSKIYTVESGCVHEGGSLDGVHGSLAAARKQALERVEYYNSGYRSINESSRVDYPDDPDMQENLRLLEEEQPNEWYSAHDYVTIKIWTISDSDDETR